MIIQYLICTLFCLLIIRYFNISIFHYNSFNVLIIRYYEDFHTIDWLRDKTKDIVRHKALDREKYNVRGFFNRYLDAASGWILVFLVGVASGLLAGKTHPL